MVILWALLKSDAVKYFVQNLDTQNLCGFTRKFRNFEKQLRNFLNTVRVA